MEINRIEYIVNLILFLLTCLTASCKAAQFLKIASIATLNNFTTITNSVWMLEDNNHKIHSTDKKVVKYYNRSTVIQVTKTKQSFLTIGILYTMENMISLLQ